MSPYQARAFFVVVSGADPSLCSFAEYLVARLMDHICCRSARLYYTTSTQPAQGCSFAPLASIFAAQYERTKEQSEAPQVASCVGPKTARPAWGSHGN